MTLSVLKRALLACTCLLLMASPVVMAQVSVSIRGVIIAPPTCVINGGGTLHVPFGSDLMTTRIDGVSYRRAVPYTVSCTGLPSYGMTLKLQGIGSGFDSTVLKTNNTNLAIKLFINGANWPLNSTVKFTYPTFPRMEAVPVKKTGSLLTAGAFSASAALVVALE